MKGSVKLCSSPDASGEYWQGWPAKIKNEIAFGLMNEIFKADGLVRWCLKNRWLLNRKKPGPRVLKLEYNQKIEFKPGQTITHYYARRCVRAVQAGKLAAISGNTDRAKMYWAMAETELERLYGSWLHSIAAKEAARVRGVKRFGEDAGNESRQRVLRVINSLPKEDRYARGVSSIIAERTGLSKTQAGVLVKKLGFGVGNKSKNGA